MTIFVQDLAIGGQGLRVAVKDCIDVAGVPTRSGSRALATGGPAAWHARVVQRVLEAGCRVVGKTTMHELAFGVSGINDWAGTPLNPRWPHLIPGGSSSGSAAAVAAGLADFSIGTDTGGSIRIPACCCGVFGLKPTFGRISRRGAWPASSSIDCVGPIAASASMLIRAMEIMDPTFSSHTVGSPRIGLVKVAAVPQVHQVIARALSQAGLATKEIRVSGLDAAFKAGVAIMNAETWTAFGHLLETGLIGADVAQRLARAEKTTREEVEAAETVRIAFTAQVDAGLDTCDVLVLPTMQDLPPPLARAGTDRSAVGMTTFVRPFNLSGHPAATVPVHDHSEEPVGLQIVGRKGEDERVLAVAAQIGDALNAIRSNAS